jgi:hypothetical protein
MRQAEPRLTEAARKSSIGLRHGAVFVRESSRSGRAPNRRMDSFGPPSASGGTTALTREPSGSRASTIGLTSSIRRPDPGDDPLNDPHHVLLIGEHTSVRSSRPRRSTNTSCGPLTRMSLTGRVLHQRLERTQAEDLVHQFVEHLAVPCFVQFLAQPETDLLGQATDFRPEQSSSICSTTERSSVSTSSS